MNPFFAWVTKIDLISFLSPSQDFALVHNFLIAAHAGYVAAEDICWVGVVVDTHDWKSFFDQVFIRQLHRHRLLVIGMQLFVVRFCKPLAGRLSADQVAGLKPAQEPAISVKTHQTKSKAKATYMMETRKRTEMRDIRIPAARRYLCHGCSSRSSN